MNTERTESKDGTTQVSKLTLDIDTSKLDHLTEKLKEARALMIELNMIAPESAH